MKLYNNCIPWYFVLQCPLLSRICNQVLYIGLFPWWAQMLWCQFVKTKLCVQGQCWILIWECCGGESLLLLQINNGCGESEANTHINDSLLTTSLSHGAPRKADFNYKEKKWHQWNEQCIRLRNVGCQECMVSTWALSLKRRQVGSIQAGIIKGWQSVMNSISFHPSI